MVIQWYIGNGGVQIGPLSQDEVGRRLASGEFSRDALAWREGMTDWLPISATPELAGFAYSPVPSAYPSAAPNSAVRLDYQVPPSQYQYFGFWWRVLAYMIDGVLLNVVGMVLGFIVGFFIGLSMGRNNNAEFVAGLVANIVGIIIGWLYFALMESSSTQATLGKMAISAKVIDTEGRRITFGRATGRYFGKILSGLILCIGFIMVGTNPRKQGLHDQLAGTLVIKK